MNPLAGTFVIIGLVVLRFALPIIVTMVFGYGMNRLLDRWQIKTGI
jgi:hypothetical protein